jgi:hypothetical protein
MHAVSTGLLVASLAMLVMQNHVVTKFMNRMKELYFDLSEKSIYDHYNDLRSSGFVFLLMMIGMALFLNIAWFFQQP